jgi:hypothetical protein
LWAQTNGKQKPGIFWAAEITKIQVAPTWREKKRAHKSELKNITIQAHLKLK